MNSYDIVLNLVEFIYLISNILVIKIFFNLYLDMVIYTITSKTVPSIKNNSDKKINDKGQSHFDFSYFRDDVNLMWHY